MSGLVPPWHMTDSRPDYMQPVTPAPLEEHDVDTDSPRYSDLELPDPMLDRALKFVVRKVLESNTWIGAVLAFLGVPQFVQDPIQQVLVGAVTIVVFFLWPEGRQEILENERKKSQ